MWNKTGKKIDTGVQVGATNIGKVGLKGSREINTDVNEHKVYDVSQTLPKPRIRMVALNITGTGGLCHLLQWSVVQTKHEHLQQRKYTLPLPSICVYFQVYSTSTDRVIELEAPRKERRVPSHR